MRITGILLCLSLCLIGATPSPAPSAETPVFSVVVMRHGVRSFTHAPTQYRWPDWQPVAPGFLTAHGYRLVRYMGRFYRSYFEAQGLPFVCRSGGLYVYADLDQRTLESARAIIDGACGSPTATAYAHDVNSAHGSNDPLFDGADWLGAAGKIDASISTAAVRAIAADPTALIAAHAPQFAALQSLLDQRCASSCTPVTAGQSNVVVSKSGLAELTGPISTASEYAESLFLETAQCGPSIDQEKLEEAMQLHVLDYDVNARNAYAPLVKGGNLFAHIVGLLETHAGMTDSDVTLPADAQTARVVVISGHDTQLGALGGILSAHWPLGGGLAPDDMPPGGALIFTLLRGQDNTYRVDLHFAYQTMAQYRSDAPVTDGIALSPVHLPGCDASSCSLPLTQMAELAHQLVTRGFVKPEWTSASTDPLDLPPLADPHWTHCAP